MHKFIAEDGTEMTFEMVEGVFGCQRFKIMVEGQITRSITLAGTDTKQHHKVLEILLAWGMVRFEDLTPWIDSVEQPI